jgi:hypothetical protein
LYFLFCEYLNILDYINFYEKAGVDFLIIVDSAQKTNREVLNKISDEDKQKYILQIEEIIKIEGGTEDLIDPKLYFRTFIRTIEKQFDFPEPDNKGERKKIVNLFKEIAEKKGSGKQQIICSKTVLA